MKALRIASIWNALHKVFKIYEILILYISAGPGFCSPITSTLVLKFLPHGYCPDRYRILSTAGCGAIPQAMDGFVQNHEPNTISSFFYHPDCCCNFLPNRNLVHLSCRYLSSKSSSKASNFKALRFHWLFGSWDQCPLMGYSYNLQTGECMVVILALFKEPVGVVKLQIRSFSKASEKSIPILFHLRRSISKVTTNNRSMSTESFDHNPLNYSLYQNRRFPAPAAATKVLPLTLRHPIAPCPLYFTATTIPPVLHIIPDLFLFHILYKAITVILK